MANILIIGDSQAGNPGAAAKRELEARSHSVVLIHHDGQSPIRFVAAGAQPGAPGDSLGSDRDMWSQYTRLARSADVILLIFGHNAPAGTRTRAALDKMRRDVVPPVLMSGPPQYPVVRDKAIGDALLAQNQTLFGARYIDAYPSTPVSLPRDRTQWHLTPESAQPWGQAMADAVERFLAAPSAAPAPSSGGGGGTALGPLGGVSRLALAAASAVAVSVLGLFWWLSQQRPVRRNRRRRR